MYKPQEIPNKVLVPPLRFSCCLCVPMATSTNTLKNDHNHNSKMKPRGLPRRNSWSPPFPKLPSSTN